MELLARHRTEGNTVGGFIVDRVADVKTLLGVAGIIGLGYLGLMEYREISLHKAVSDFASRMTDKLNDPTHKLSVGEKFYPRVRVVAAGETLADRLEMQKAGIPINVRYHPGSVLRNGVDIPVVGTLAQSSEIPNVFLTVGDQVDYALTSYWVAFKCANAPVKWGQGQKPTQGAICVIDADYAVAVPSK